MRWRVCGFADGAETGRRRAFGGGNRRADSPQPRSSGLRSARSGQPEFFLVLFAGDEHGVIGQFGSKQGLLVGAAGHRQGDLAAFGGAALHGEHDLGPEKGVLEVALVHFPEVVQPIGHFLDVGRHVEVVVYGAFASLIPSGLSDRRPAPSLAPGDGFRIGGFKASNNVLDYFYLIAMLQSASS